MFEFSFGYLIFMIIIMIGIWLLLRVVALWYFKIDERRDLLEKILNELSVLNGDKSPYKSEREKKEKEKLEKERLEKEQLEKEKHEQEKNNNQEKDN